MELVKVLRNGQLTLPKKLRLLLGLSEGVMLEVSLTHEGVLLKPVETTPRKVTMRDITERTNADLAAGRYTRIQDQATLDKFLENL